MSGLKMLRVEGSSVVDSEGHDFVLRGVGIGGWLNMENFITGYPGTEVSHRRKVAEALGPELGDYFFECFLASFFDRNDAEFIASAGFNSVRIPVNGAHFLTEDGSLTDAGFRYVDRAIEDCGEFGLYSIIDLHALPGGQNQDWHSDNETHRAHLWENGILRRQTSDIWRMIAERYCGRTEVAGYNLINEPGVKDGRELVELYASLAETVRTADPDHMLFLDGNTYAREFEGFDRPLDNTVYAIHEYPLPGRIDGLGYPGTTGGRHFDRSVFEEDFLKETSWIREVGAPIWVGEFGPIYPKTSVSDAWRYEVLRDQLDVYRTHHAGWSLWTYKDIGLQGVVTVKNSASWMKLMEPMLAKKARLGADSWGGSGERIRHVTDPIERLLAEEFPTWRPYPFGQSWLVKRLIRNIAISEGLAHESVELFRGLDREKINELMRSFEFRETRPNKELLAVLGEYL